MSLITRCPACGTLFKVVPDQLRISQGWVRCGQCAEVFDASSDLRQADVERVAAAPDVMAPWMEAPAVSEAAAESPHPPHDEDMSTFPVAEPPSPAEERWPEPEPLPSSTQANEAPAWDAAPPDAAGVDAIDAPYPLHASDPYTTTGDDIAEPAPSVPLPDVPLTISGPTLDVAMADAPADESSGDLGAPSPETSLDAPATALEPDAADTPSDAMPLPERPTADQPADPVREPTPVAPQDSMHRNLSFIRHAPPVEPRWRTSLRRAVWVFAGVALLTGLGLQIALQERDRIAAAAPATMPWLQALCAPVHCAVQPLREIEAIVIDGSSFSALRSDGYRLGVTVRNRADHALALPAIELSLTDIEEQPVVRRVLLPAELSASSLTIAARGDWSTSVDLSLADKAGRARVVGYRLLAFYP